MNYVKIYWNTLKYGKIDSRGGAEKSPWLSNNRNRSIPALFSRLMDVLNSACQNLESEGLGLVNSVFLLLIL